jgi:EmrB/QacA subfamily drug resistance transporter
VTTDLVASVPASSQQEAIAPGTTALDHVARLPGLAEETTVANSETATAGRDSGSRGAAPARESSPSWSRRKKLILAAICVAQFMVVLDIAVVNVALPSIKTDLNFTNESLQWVVSAYAILFGGFLLLGGRLADLWGARRLFMVGLGIFSVASLMCGFAWSETSLITFRAIQGLGGALLSPAALSILVNTYAEGRERNLALGIWGGIAGSGAAAGTLLGGVLTSGLGWQWIFYINVPIGLALIAFSPLLLLADERPETRRGFDIPGATAVTAGLMLLVYGLTRATQIGWSAGETLGLLAGAAALLIAFLVVEFRSRVPVLPLRVLHLPTPRAANIIGFLIGAAVFAQFFLLSLYMQQVLHYSALRTGVAYVASTVLSVVFAVVAQALVTRMGTRVPLAAGMILVGAALLLYIRLPVNGHYFTDLLPGFILTGLGLGLSFVPVSIAALTGVRPLESGAASGMINTSQQIGGAVGLAAMATVATTATTHYLQAHPGTGIVQLTGLTHGFRVAFGALAGVAFLGALATPLIRRTKSAPQTAGLPIFAEPAIAGAGGEAAFGQPCAVNVLGIVGRPWSDASDGVLFRTAREMAPSGMTISEFDLSALPPYSDGPTTGHLPEAVQRLRAAIVDAEALLVVAADDENGAPATSKNAIDWASHPHLAATLTGKPVVVMAASPTDGATTTAQEHIRETLRSRGATVLAELELLTRGEREPADAPRHVTDDGARQSVGELLGALCSEAPACEAAA